MLLSLSLSLSLSSDLFTKWAIHLFRRKPRGTFFKIYISLLFYKFSDFCSVLYFVKSNL